MEIKRSNIMEMKKCPFCDGVRGLVSSSGAHRIEHFVFCATCGARGPSFYPDKAMDDYTIINNQAIDAWNGRVEPNPSETDRWFEIAIAAQARAELAEMQRDELSEALEQAKRILAYSGGLQ